MKTADASAWACLAIIAAVALAIVSWFAPHSAAVARARESAPAVDAPEPAISFRYRVNAPSQTLVLSDNLDEISDLSLAADHESLWTVHDEKGILYRISIADGSILQQIEFQKKGDFESVATVGEQVVVGRSDGVLFVVDPKTEETTHFATQLGVACNLEGLCWDALNSRLLLACKSPQGSGSNRHWAVYALNLATRRMEKDPVFVVTGKAIADYLARHPEQPELRSSMATQFDPSAITIHPQSGLIYLTSTRGRMLAVLSPTGKLLRIEALERAVHPQPEGIAFLPDGTMFISSEARGKHPLLQRFTQDAQVAQAEP